MSDLLDDNKKPIISFAAQQPIQEVNEGKIKFHFADKEKQRRLNFGKKPDPEQIAERSLGRHQRSLVLNLTKGDLQRITYPSAVIVNIYPVYDDFGNIIPPTDPRFLTTKPVRVTFQVSDRHPFPLTRFDKYDLDNYITEKFGKYIISEISESKAEHDEHFKGIKDVLFAHSGLLQANEATGKDELNKRSFNVYGAKVFDHELNHLNKRLEIIGAKPIKTTDALLRTQKTIEKPAYNIFELGDF